MRIVFGLVGEFALTTLGLKLIGEKYFVLICQDPVVRQGDGNGERLL
jgi:hypothetical protein